MTRLLAQGIEEHPLQLILQPEVVFLLFDYSNAFKAIYLLQPLQLAAVLSHEFESVGFGLFPLIPFPDRKVESFPLSQKLLGLLLHT